MTTDQANILIALLKTAHAGDSDPISAAGILEILDWLTFAAERAGRWDASARFHAARVKLQPNHAVERPCF